MTSATEKCMICLDAFTVHSVKFETDECKHEFHKGCFSIWYRKNKSCPYCRATIHHFSLTLNEIVVEWSVDGIADYLRCSEACVDDTDFWGGDLLLLAVLNDQCDKVAFFLDNRQLLTIGYLRELADEVVSAECATIILKAWDDNPTRALINLENSNIFDVVNDNPGTVDIECNESLFLMAWPKAPFLVKYFIKHHTDVYNRIGADKVREILVESLKNDDSWPHMEMLQHPSFRDRVESRLFIPVFEQDDHHFLKLALKTKIITEEEQGRTFFNSAVDVRAFKCASVMVESGWLRLNERGSIGAFPIETLLRNRQYTIALSVVRTCPVTTDTKLCLLAVPSGNLELIDKLVDDSVNPKELLYAACRVGLVDVVRWIFDVRFKGIDPNFQIRVPLTGFSSPLTIAIERCHMEVVDFLYEHGCDHNVFEQQMEHCTSVHMLELLLNFVSTDAPVPNSVIDMLIESEDSVACFEKLVKFTNVHVNGGDGDNDPILVRALRNARFDLVDVLLMDVAGVDVNAYHNRGNTDSVYPKVSRTPLWTACSLLSTHLPTDLVRIVATIERLCHMGADPNIGMGVMDCVGLALVPRTLDVVLSLVDNRQMSLDKLLCNVLNIDTRGTLNRSLVNTLTAGANPLSLRKHGRSDGLLLTLAKKGDVAHGVFPFVIDNLGDDISSDLLQGDVAIETLLRREHAPLTRIAIDLVRAGAVIRADLINTIVFYGTVGTISRTLVDRLISELLVRQPSLVDHKVRGGDTPIMSLVNFNFIGMSTYRILLTHGARVDSAVITQAIMNLTLEIVDLFLHFAPIEAICDEHIKIVYENKVSAFVLDSLLQKHPGGLDAVRCGVVDAGFSGNDLEVARVLMRHGKSIDDILVEGCDSAFVHALSRSKRAR